MPNIKELTRLFRAISARDLGAAEEVASQIISGERKKGHSSAAQSLNAALKDNGFRGHRGLEPLTGSIRDGNFLVNALTQWTAVKRLSDIMLRKEARSEIIELIKETKHGKFIESKGLRRRTKLILVGPPGCGKTLAAQAIANELGYPLYVIRFDAVIGSYLGQTATNLRELFKFAANNTCVLLFDEVDALGKQRGNSLDVGELDRIVIAMMQELELFNAPGLLIATSNLPDSLDRALWRRFDSVIRFPSPTKPELQEFARTLGQKLSVRIDDNILKGVVKQPSYADAEKVVESAARRIALQKLKV